MTKRLALALAATLAAGQVAAQEIPDIPFTRHVLKNGLTLIVHEDHKAPIVAVNVWYHVGSKNERPGRTGFAHLFEHLMFNGSENFNDDYFKVLERIGATDLNGTTNNDRTNYFQNVPVTALDTVLWMESDRMGHLVGVIDQARLDEQRGVVQNEKRQGENEPYGRVEEVATPSIYPKGHPYSWTVIGSMEDLNAASLADVKEWFKTYYGPNNATLVVAGDVKAADVVARVERFFGALPPGPPLDRQESWVARRTGEQRQALQDRVPQVKLYFTWNTAEWGTQDDVLLGVAAQVLSSGKSSRLFKRLVYDDQTCTGVVAAQSTNEIGSNFNLEVSVRPGADPAKVEAAVKEELARFLAKGPTADELERARTQRLAGFIRGVERIGGFGGKSDVLAEHQVYGGDAGRYQQRFGWVKSATAKGVQAAAQRWLADGLYLLTVQPFAEAEVAGADADRTKRPEPGTPPEARFPAFERKTLSNGLDLVVARRAAVPVVNLDLYVDAGYASDLGQLAGTAKLAAGMLDEGTASRTSLQISDELQRLGASLSTGANLDQTTVQLSALKANLDATLALYADVLLHPSFPQADFDRLKKQQLVAIDQESKEPFGIAQRVVPRLLYGAAHPYGNPLTGSGTVPSVKQITRDGVQAWYRTWFKPGRATLVVVGDTTLAEIAPKLEKALGAWRAGAPPPKAIGQPAAAQAGVYVIDRPGAIQSLVLMGVVAPPRARASDLPQQVMNTVLGGQFTSRVNMNLREDKHWAYGAYTFLIGATGPRPYLGYAPVQSDKTKESLAEFVKELRGIRGEKPATADELDAAKSSITLALPGEWETGRAVARSVNDLVRYKLGDDYYDGYVARVRAVTPQDVAAAGQLLDPARTVWVVVGDRAKIEAGLKELGLGEVRVIDADGNPVAAK